MEEIQIKVRNYKACPKPLTEVLVGKSEASTLGVNQPNKVNAGTYGQHDLEKSKSFAIAQCLGTEDHQCSHLEKCLNLLLSEAVQHRHWALMEIRRLILSMIRNRKWPDSTLSEFVDLQNLCENLFLIYRLLSDSHNTIAFEALHLLAEFHDSSSQIQWLLVCEGLPDSHVKKIEHHACSKQSQSTLHWVFQRSNEDFNLIFSCQRLKNKIFVDPELYKTICRFIELHLDTAGAREHHSAISLLIFIALTCSEGSAGIWKSIRANWLKKWTFDLRTRVIALQLLFILCKTAPAIIEEVIVMVKNIPLALNSGDTACAYILLAIFSAGKNVICASETREWMKKAIACVLPSDLFCTSDSLFFLYLRCIASLGSPLNTLIKAGRSFLAESTQFALENSQFTDDILRKNDENLQFLMHNRTCSYLLACLKLVHVATHAGMGSCFTESSSNLEKQSFMKSFASGSVGESESQLEDVITSIGAPDCLLWWPQRAPEMIWCTSESSCIIYCGLLKNSRTSPETKLEKTISLTETYLRMVLSETLYNSQNDDTSPTRVPISLSHLSVLLSRSPQAQLIQLATYYEIKLLYYAALWLSSLDGYHTHGDDSPMVHPIMRDLSRKLVSLLVFTWFPFSRTPLYTYEMIISSIFQPSVYKNLNQFFIRESHSSCLSIDIYSIMERNPSKEIITEWIDWFFHTRASFGQSSILMTIIDGHSIIHRLFSGIIFFAENFDSGIPGLHQFFKQLCKDIFYLAEGNLHALGKPIDVTKEIISRTGQITVIDPMSEFLLGTLVTVMPFFHEELLCEFLQVWKKTSMNSFVDLSLVGEAVDVGNDARNVVSWIENAKLQYTLKQSTVDCVQEFLSLLPKGARSNGLVGTTLQQILEKNKYATKLV